MTSRSPRTAGSRAGCRYDGSVIEKPPLWDMSREEFNEMLRDLPSATSDDVSITKDGRRLDTKEKVLEFLAELEAERAAERAAAGDAV